jgi:hypothetical protein
MVKVLITTVVLTHDTSAVNTVIVDFETKNGSINGCCDYQS